MRGRIILKGEQVSCAECRRYAIIAVRVYGHCSLKLGLKSSATRKFHVNLVRYAFASHICVGANCMISCGFRGEGVRLCVRMVSHYQSVFGPLYPQRSTGSLSTGQGTRYCSLVAAKAASLLLC